jgi:hypothetical protein
VAHVIVNVAHSDRAVVDVIQELGLYITSQVS